MRYFFWAVVEAVGLSVSSPPEAAVVVEELRYRQITKQLLD
jgi:hypothetical protein